MWIDEQIMRRCQEPLCCISFVPETEVVVLGRSNVLETEVNLSACQEATIPILRRLGGGGTVLLYPGCLVVSLGLWLKHFYQNDFYFQKINAALISCVEKNCPNITGLYQDGISDIVLNSQKIGGTSLFRSRNYLLYQASILVSNTDDLISRYLAHPTKEPNYRQGKDHATFLTYLDQVQNGLTPEDLKSFFDQDFISLLLSGEIAEHLIPAPKVQVRYIEARGKNEI